MTQKNFNTESLFQRLKSPWQLLRSNSFGLRINYQPAFWVILAAIGINLLCFFVGIFRFFQLGISISGLVAWVSALFLGIVAVIYTFRQVYQYLLIELLRAIYTSISALVQKVSANLVQRAEQLFLQKSNLSAEQLEKALQLPQLLQTQYAQLPAFLRQIIAFLLSNIPFVSVLLDLREQILSNKSAATAQFQEKVSQLSSRFLVQNTTLQTVYSALVGLFLLVVVVLIYLI